MMNRQLAQKPFLLCSNSADSNPTFSAQIQLIQHAANLQLSDGNMKYAYLNLFFSNC